MSLPQRYDTPVGERGDTLSGGQRQRIAIARAIIRNPSVLLLDEATSALDQTTEAAINRTLLKVAKGRTMIWSTHRLTSVVEMDEIIVISGGRAIERGSHADCSPPMAPIASCGTTRAISRTCAPVRRTTTTKMTTRRMTTRRSESLRLRFRADSLRSRRNVPSTEPRHEARPALRVPIRPVVDRDLAEAEGLRRRPGVAGLLDRILVEGGDLGLVHAFGGEPGGIWILQSRATSVNTLSVPVPATGQEVAKASPTRTMPGLR